MDSAYRAKKVSKDLCNMKCEGQGWNNGGKCVGKPATEFGKPYMTAYNVMGKLCHSRLCGVS